MAGSSFFNGFFSQWIPDYVSLHYL